MLGRARLLGFAVTLAIVAFGLWRLDLSAVADALRAIIDEVCDLVVLAIEPE